MAHAGKGDKRGITFNSLTWKRDAVVYTNHAKSCDLLSTLFCFAENRLISMLQASEVYLSIYFEEKKKPNF